MKMIKSMLVIAATVIGASASANDYVEVRFGNDTFKDLSSCGSHARVKAVRASDGMNVVRVCDAVNCTAGNVLVNTNRNFEISGDGKTQYLPSLNHARRVNENCMDIPLPYGYENVRLVIQSGTGKTKGFIFVEGI